MSFPPVSLTVDLLSGTIVFLLVAAVSGVSMAIQGSINSALGKIVGLWETTLIVHLTATIAVSVILFAFNLGKGSFLRAGEAPWYYYLGGFLGILITYGVVITIPKLGAAVATTAIIVGQVGMAALVDHFGLFGLQQIPFTWLKFVGLVLLAAGAKLLLT